uniref:Uncharacterized protein n=1 Tax=Glossina pallidipes TaxID=7398 RepID=A0A1A9ZTE9_GLOPL
MHSNNYFELHTITAIYSTLLSINIQFTIRHYPSKESVSTTAVFCWWFSGISASANTTLNFHSSSTRPLNWGIAFKSVSAGVFRKPITCCSCQEAQFCFIQIYLTIKGNGMKKMRLTTKQQNELDTKITLTYICNIFFKYYYEIFIAEGGGAKKCTHKLASDFKQEDTI